MQASRLTRAVHPAAAGRDANSLLANCFPLQVINDFAARILVDERPVISPLIEEVSLEYPRTALKGLACERERLAALVPSSGQIDEKP